MQVHTGTYWNILVHTGTDFNCTHASFRRCSTSFPTPASLHTTLGLFHARSAFPQDSLLHRETTQAGLAAPKHPEPSVDFIHIAATPAMSICCVGAAHGEGRPLVLAELVWDCRCRVTSQRQENEGYSTAPLAEWLRRKRGPVTCDSGGVGFNSRHPQRTKRAFFALP